MNFEPAGRQESHLQERDFVDETLIYIMNLWSVLVESSRERVSAIPQTPQKGHEMKT